MKTLERMPRQVRTQHKLLNFDLRPGHPCPLPPIFRYGFLLGNLAYSVFVRGGEDFLEAAAIGRPD